MSELKPCPFCGGEAEMRIPLWWLSTFRCDIVCRKCRCRTMEYKGNCAEDVEALAIEAWNRRAE